MKFEEKNFSNSDIVTFSSYDYDQEKNEKHLNTNAKIQLGTV